MAAGVGGAAVVLTACDVLDGPSGDEGPGVSPDASVDAVDADSTLVEEVGEAIASTAALATATGAAYPALTGLGTRLAKVHEVHARGLGRTTPAPAPTIASGNSALARQQLLAAEQQLQTRLVEAAQQAESGSLAQLIASMAAAVAQQRAVLA